MSGWAPANKQEICISVYDSAEALLFAFDEDKALDILLLDIQMKEMDGITLAKRLRGGDERMQIVFITGFPDFIWEGYDVAALHYLMKTVSELKLKDVLDRACAKLNTSQRTVLLPADDGTIRVPVDEILYAEVFSHNVELHTGMLTHHIKLSMSELEQVLGNGFFRCHRSYILGLRHVHKVTRTSMALDNGVQLPLSRKLYDDANQAFIRYNSDGA